MIIRETDTPTLQDALEILVDSRDHSSHNQRVLQIRIKIKAIEITLAERTTT